jgi:hypothetical protein
MDMGEPDAVGAAGSSPTSRPRLGELLVQRGLLTPEQLGGALAEQQASGLPLGAIVVRDGLVASHTIAILLAEQSGGPLKTEFGYALGAAPAEPAGADVLSLHPPTAPTLSPGPPVSEPPVDGLRLALPESRPEEETAIDPVPILEPRIRELEAQLAAEVTARTALERKLADVEAGTEAALAGQAELATLHDRLAALELRAQEVDALRASETRPVTRRPYTLERHILLAPVDDRYELVERAGPPPEAGSRVDLFEDRAFLVVRVGPAPIPGALEACAYLERIPTRLPPPDADTEPT